jgi:2-isopropylmalate synthase
MMETGDIAQGRITLSNRNRMKPARNRKVELFDTSLRDGLQQPNLEISVPNAVTFLQRMSAFGVQYAEIGFAGANQFVADLTQRLGSVDTGAMRLALFGRTRGRGTKVQDWPDVQFMIRHKARVPVAVVVVKSRLLDVDKSLATTPQENLLMACETIQCLQDHGLEVIVDFEHAMDALCARRENGEACNTDLAKRSVDYFHEMTASCVREKVSRLIICDTTGGAGPEEVTEVFTGLTRAYPNAIFGFHGHTDRGLGIANTRAAIFAGAVQIQGTILGTGERCGNVNLTTVVGSMQLRQEAEFVSPESLVGLTALAHSAYAAFRLDPPHGAPIVGPGAFGTWAGMHGSSEHKDPGAYLWCDPARVGAKPRIGVNGQSGRANIMLLSKSLDVALDAAQAQVLMDSNLAMIEGGGFTSSEVSFTLACMKVLKTLKNRFSIKGWKVLDESDAAGNRFVRASMSLSIGDSAVRETQADGAGPVDALTKAMRQELENWYPPLKQIRLDTFSVTAIDVSAHDTAAHVRVTASFHAEGHEPWTTAAVSSDLNQAALMAIVDGFHYWLLKSSD